MKNLRKVTGLIFILVFMLGNLTAAEAGEGTYKVIDHAALKAKVEADQRDFLLVDARNPEEYREAHIPGAINIPQKKIDAYQGLLPADKHSEIIFYCNGVKCGKSKKAAKKAIELGYSNVLVYAEGMPVWEEMGYSFYKGGDYEKKIETTKISPRELQQFMSREPDGIIVVDVRDPEEFKEDHIPGAINLPLKNFAAGSSILGKDKTIVVYCNSGGRSYGAYKKLMKLGYKKIFQAIYADWKGTGLQIES
jgi:rhodanese-related sulfurtransferase